MDKNIINIKLSTDHTKPNVNGYIYDQTSLENAIAEFNNRNERYLTNNILYDNDIKDFEFNEINPESIVSNDIKINIDNLECSFTKLKDINTEELYAGYRIIAKIKNNSDPRTVLVEKIICMDLMQCTNRK